MVARSIALLHTLSPSAGYVEKMIAWSAGALPFASESAAGDIVAAALS